MTSPGIGRFFRLLRQGRPAAGANWTITVGGQRYLRVVSLTARLATSAVVANRRVRITASEDGEVYFIAEAHLNQAASLTFDYVGHTGSAVTAADNTVLPLPLPTGGLLLRPGAVLAASVTALDAGDQWTALRMLAEEIPSGPKYQGDMLDLIESENPGV